MRRRERERAPAWASWAAPGPWRVTSLTIGFVVALSMVVVGLPVLLIPGIAMSFGLAADIYWRRTRPPSEDARWSPLARLFYKRAVRPE